MPRFCISFNDFGGNHLLIAMRDLVVLLVRDWLSSSFPFLTSLNPFARYYLDLQIVPSSTGVPSLYTTFTGCAQQIFLDDADVAKAFACRGRRCSATGLFCAASPSGNVIFAKNTLALGSYSVRSSRALQRRGIVSHYMPKHHGEYPG